MLTAFSITFLTHLNNDNNNKKNDHPLLGLSSKVFTFDDLFTFSFRLVQQFSNFFD